MSSRAEIIRLLPCTFVRMIVGLRPQTIPVFYLSEQDAVGDSYFALPVPCRSTQNNRGSGDLQRTLRTVADCCFCSFLQDAVGIGYFASL